MAYKAALRARALGTPVAPLPPLKVHKFKYSLPQLDSYKASEVPAAFWDHWQKLPLDVAIAGNRSWIDPEALLQAARDRGVQPVGLLESCSMLRQGADLGCVGRGRLPTRALNAEKLLEDGPIICDVLQSWVEQGIAAGPLTLEQLQAVFGEDYTVNTLATRPKPTGALRIIVDMSSPRDKDAEVPGWLWPPWLPGAVNTSIDPAQFPARMTSIKNFLRMLFKVGRGALICKVDWTDAYKHVKVRPQDLKLQVITFAGRFFVELKLVFGARSSPGLYDTVSNVIRDLAVAESHILRSRVAKHLDDILGIGTPSPLDPVHSFFEAYLELAEEVGVRLPPPDVDKSKCQSPATTVLALGMDIDTVAWQIRCPEQKLGRILHALRQCLALGSVTMGELASLVGQLQDKMILLVEARFNFVEISRLVNSEESPEQEVKLTPAALKQMKWWFVNLQVTAWYCPITHPDAALWPPVAATVVWSDAAGGTLVNLKVGVGILLPGGGWSYFPWPWWLKAGLPGPEGYPLNAQLQFLELCGPLIALSAGAKSCMNKAVNFRLDNMSAVYVWRKGYSTRDRLSSTVVKAIFDLAQRLNASPFVTKVARCSTPGAAAVDALSKGEFGMFFKISADSGPEPLRIPGVLVRWLNSPVADDDLGQRIAEDLKRSGLNV